MCCLPWAFSDLGRLAPAAIVHLAALAHASCRLAGGFWVCSMRRDWPPLVGLCRRALVGTGIERCSIQGGSATFGDGPTNLHIQHNVGRE